MRDAFGGVFMIRMILVVLFIYVSFTAVSLNYAKAFRMKNAVIDIIEEGNLVSIEDIENVDIKTKLDNLISKFNYNKECKNGNHFIKDETFNDNDGYCYEGILIKQISSDSRNVIYEVTTVADWNLGTLNNLLSFSGKSGNEVNGAWSITGTAKVAK